VGGRPVLGYDVDAGGRRLMVNEGEAERVRAIFDIFAERGSVEETWEEIHRRGWRTKSWTRKTGEFREGGEFTLGVVRRLLTNRAYTGMTIYKGLPYPGEHAAIVSTEVWDNTQKLMTERHITVRAKVRNKHQALLHGLLYCDCCSARMVYSYSQKNGRRYPYYVCLHAQREGWANCPSKSLPAKGIEESVVARVRAARVGIRNAADWEEMDRAVQIQTMQRIVERIGYDGTTRQMSIRFHKGREVRDDR